MTRGEIWGVMNEAAHAVLLDLLDSGCKHDSEQNGYAAHEARCSYGSSLGHGFSFLRAPGRILPKLRQASALLSRACVVELRFP